MKTVNSNKIKVVYLILILLIASCKNQANQEDESVIAKDCPSKYDSLFFAMEPINNKDSEISFIDLRECLTYIKDDSLIIEINTRVNPDSIAFNNPNINKGYAEFGLDVVYRNKNYTNKHNIVFSLYYDNLDKPNREIRDSYNKFIKTCSLAIYLEHEDSIDVEGKIIEKNEYVISDKAINVIADKKAIYFKIAKDSVCHLIEDYFQREFYVKMCYNNAKEKGVNNYLTSYLGSDSLLIHSFKWNSSRRIK